MADVHELLDTWIANVKDEELLAELNTMKEQGDEDAITDAFFQDLAFGTAGLRGTIGAGTNRMNIYTVGRATQGFADYLNATFEHPTVAIARDSRNKGELFVKTTAAILAANGVTALVYPKISPVPTLSWAVRDLKCSGGICMTASHNPAPYNGYKAYGPDGCQITNEAADAISKAIAETDTFTGVKSMDFDEATSALDPQTTSSILELLKKINRQFGITIVIITHQMSVVREICTHVAIMYEGEVVEKGLVADIFANPQSEVAKELIRKDTGSDIDADSRLDAGREKGQAEIKSGEKIRIVFSENSAFEPVIANLILTFGEPVNILKADTKNVGGVAKGEMILEFMEGSTRTEMMKQYLKEKGLAIGEVTEYVGS